MSEFYSNYWMLKLKRNVKSVAIGGELSDNSQDFCQSSEVKGVTIDEFQ